MRDYNLQNCSEGIAAAASCISRMTVLRRLQSAGPLAELRRLLAALAEGDAALAQDRYHALTAELLKGGYRRVSGDLWKDFLLGELLETENVFSAMAARGEKDLPVMNAMRAELSLLASLAELSGETLKTWTFERYREMRGRTRPQDNIAMMSNAVWTGGSRAAQKEPAPIPASLLPAGFAEDEWLRWEYDAQPEFGGYVSDEALEEIYHRLLHSEDWRDCLEDLWNFHAAYGDGQFLKRRLFSFSGGRLEPLAEDGAPGAELLFHEEEHTELMQEVIRFMQGEQPERMLLTGGAGSGKTTGVISLAQELPEVRLILADGRRTDGLCGLCELLRRQPLRFLLLIDDAVLESKAFAALRSGIAGGGIGGANIMCVVTAREGDDSLFTRKLEFREPTFKEFVELAQRILAAEGIEVDYDEVQDACIDYKAAEKNLSFTAAVRVAQTLRRKLSR